ncbi:MAG: hypothetical protein ACOC04_04845 [Halothece sp.]
MTDQVTEGRGSIRSMIIGVEQQEPPKILLDYQVLARLNSLLHSLPRSPDTESLPPNQTHVIIEQLELAKQLISQSLDSLDIPFREPDIEPLVLIHSN